MKLSDKVIVAFAVFSFIVDVVSICVLIASIVG